MDLFGKIDDAICILSILHFSFDIFKTNFVHQTTIVRCAMNETLMQTRLKMRKTKQLRLHVNKMFDKHTLTQQINVCMHKVVYYCIWQKNYSSENEKKKNKITK